MSRFAFWVSFSGVCYAYFGYPVLLRLIRIVKGGKTKGEDVTPGFTPSVSLIIPAHNEANRIESKIRNALSLDYPREDLEIIVVSDGSTDETNSIVRKFRDDGVTFVELEVRRGKAQALNEGLAAAKGDIVVFSDSSIILESSAIRNIVRQFRDETVGCVSGEDHIRDGGGEGLYGKYELYLRNLESVAFSIVGASGCLYAQRRHLCLPFREGMAPDFFSVLVTVEKGYKAVSEPSAIGYMTAVKMAKDEFPRKERTILRGMTTMYHKRSLLNPLRYGVFSLSLFSHKIMRWLVPFLLILLFASNLLLLEDRFFRAAFIAQCAFYLLALASFIGRGGIRGFLFKVPYFFCISNAAILTATVKYLRGIRQEIWTPTKR